MLRWRFIQRGSDAPSLTPPRRPAVPPVSGDRSSRCRRRPTSGVGEFGPVDPAAPDLSDGFPRRRGTRRASGDIQWMPDWETRRARSRDDRNWPERNPIAVQHRLPETRRRQHVFGIEGNGLMAVERKTDNDNAAAPRKRVVDARGSPVGRIFKRRTKGLKVCADNEQQPDRSPRRRRCGSEDRQRPKPASIATAARKNCPNRTAPRSPRSSGNMLYEPCDTVGTPDRTTRQGRRARSPSAIRARDPSRPHPSPTAMPPPTSTRR